MQQRLLVQFLFIASLFSREPVRSCQGARIWVCSTHLFLDWFLFAPCTRYLPPIFSRSVFIVVCIQYPCSCSIFRIGASLPRQMLCHFYLVVYRSLGWWSLFTMVDYWILDPFPLLLGGFSPMISSNGGLLVPTIHLPCFPNLLLWLIYLMKRSLCS